VSRKQLLKAGLSPDAIDRRLKAGRLHPLHRGVYLVGHRVAPRHALELAAVLACGPRSVLSYRSAAALWGLFPYPARAGLQHVTVIARNPGPKPRIRIHRVKAFDPADLSAYERIPITSPARTLVDIAAGIPVRELEGAVAEAMAKRLVTTAELEACLDRNHARRGASRLRALLEDDIGPALTRSEAERRMLDLIRRAGLPAPNVNARVGGFEIDFLWRAQRLIVEVDGFQFHSSRLAFERDRFRDGELGSRGFRVIRVTWRQLVNQQDALLRRLARALTTTPETR
jgi:very-short-patch-repair endonuclease